MQHSSAGYLLNAKPSPTNGYSTCVTTMSSGVPPTSAGSPVTPTSPMVHWRRVRRSSCTKAHRLFRTAAGSGVSVSVTASRSSTPRRPRSGALMRLGDDIPGAVRSVEDPAAGDGRRADQPGGLDLVSRGHRQRALPYRRHLVADRDRCDHDFAAPGATPTKPGSCTKPIPGIDVDIVDEAGDLITEANQGGVPRHSRSRGRRCCARSGATTIVISRPTGKNSRIVTTSPATARIATSDGYIWIMGRIDDVLNVSGHRLGTMEVESALVAHERVAEAAVVGYPSRREGRGHLRLRRVPWRSSNG